MQYSFTSLLPDQRVPCDLERMRRLSVFPDIEPSVASREGQRLGLAGELYLRAELTALGFDVAALPVQSAADLGLVLGDRLVRIQVKTVLRPRGGYYYASFRRGYRGSATGTYDYDLGDFDIGAVVMLRHKAIAFTVAGQRSCRIPVTRMPELQRRKVERLYEALCSIGALEPGEIDAILAG